MSELEQYGDSAEGRRHALKKRGTLGLVALGLVAVAAVGVGLWRSGVFAPPAPVSAPLPVEAPAPAPVAAEAAAPVEAPAPGSAASGEALLQKLGAELSASADVKGWLAQPGILQRLAAAVNLIASGETPRPVLAFLAPAKEFSVVKHGEKLVAAPESFERYAPFTRAVLAIDPIRAGRAYGKVAPYFQAAFREIGKPGQKFDAVLHTAIGQLLATPVPAAAPDLRAKGLGYVYADAELESLSAAQKQLLRLGPVQATGLQTWLRSFEGALGR